MSTKKPVPSSKGTSKKTPGSSNPPGSEKKRKSAGFIETTGFKPNWLETGPISPDMLPDSAQTEDPQLTVDEFEALQASLQRFYQQVESDTPSEDSPQETAGAIDKPTEEVLSENSANAETEPDIDIPPTVYPEEAIVNQPAPIEPAEDIRESSVENLDTEVMGAAIAQMNDSWVQPLLEADPVVSQVKNPALPPSTLIEQLWAQADAFVEEHPDEPTELGETFKEPEAVPEIESVSPIEAFPPIEAVSEIEPITEIPAIEPAPEEAAQPIAPAQPKVKAPKVKKRRDRLSAVMLLLSLLLLAAAALIYFVNPFSRLALGSASLARPVSSPAITPPRLASGDWCLQGGFLDVAAPSPQLIDSGLGGDILAEDRVFSLEHQVSQPGTYEWQVVDCADSNVVYPAAPAWITTSEPDQSVIFIFDSNERSDPLFFPIPYVVSATDATTDYRVIGSFQDWNPEDTSGQLERISNGLYQQVRRIARPGSYEAYVIAGEEDQAIDAYGRTTAPIPFSFQTDRNGDYVIFLVDTDRGRASVMYDMPPVFTSLAFGNGYQLLSLVLATLAGLILLGLLVRLLIVRNKRLQMESGCPNCGRPELMRIARQRGDRFLHLFGIPAYRYRCRHCTWEGTRLSETGASVSSGVPLARFNDIY